MHHETDDANATKILGMACKALREGNLGKAQRIFGGLAQRRHFSYRGQAAYGEAIALARAGKITEASKKLGVLKDEFTDSIILRAKILRAFAETKIKLNQFDGIDEVLEEAARIFKDQGELSYLGAVVSLQGVVATQKDTDLSLPIENFEWAEMFGETLFPDFVPEKWVTEQPVETPALAAATSSLVAGGIS